MSKTGRWVFSLQVLVLLGSSLTGLWLLGSRDTRQRATQSRGRRAMVSGSGLAGGFGSRRFATDGKSHLLSVHGRTPRLGSAHQRDCLRSAGLLQSILLRTHTARRRPSVRRRRTHQQRRWREVSGPVRPRCKRVVAAPGYERGTLVPDGDDACRWKCAHRVGQRRSGCRPQHPSAGVGQWQLARFVLGTDPLAVLPDDDARAQRQGVLRRAGAVHQISRHHRHRGVDGWPDERWRKPLLRKWSDVRARQDPDRRRGRSAARVGGSDRPQSAEPELAAGGIDVESPAVSRTPPCFPMAQCSSQAAAAARVSTIPMLPSMQPSSGILRRAPSRRFQARRIYRGYHSIAMLLPDGRVLSSGGDGEPNAEVFSPPYLFKGARPSITSAPQSLSYGLSFSVATPNATSISTVSLVRLSTVTHSTNMNQRFLRLPFSQAERRAERHCALGGRDRASGRLHAVPREQHRRAIGWIHRAAWCRGAASCSVEPHSVGGLRAIE